MQRENLCNVRPKEASENKTPPWNMSDLEEVLKRLKLNKSRDPMGLSNELFKSQIAGSDLKEAILCLMNQIKTQ